MKLGIPVSSVHEFALDLLLRGHSVLLYSPYAYTRDSVTKHIFLAMTADGYNVRIDRKYNTVTFLGATFIASSFDPMTAGSHFRAPVIIHHFPQQADLQAVQATLCNLIKFPDGQDGLYVVLQ